MPAASPSVGHMRKRRRSSATETAALVSSSPRPTSTDAELKLSSTSLLISSRPSALSARLSSARFRWLNERLYTLSSADAASYFAQHPREFAAYHDGFRQQVSRWPQQPLAVIVQHLRSLPPSVVADMGCGDALIARTLHPRPHTVHSFDLVSSNPLVTACNIAHTPLPDASVDVAVFCLSLMGTDWAAFVEEGWRVLRPGGELLVAELTSRMQGGGGVDGFVAALRAMGFEQCRIVHQGDNGYFVCAFLTKAQRSSVGSAERAAAAAAFTLAPCLYKKR